MTIPLPLFLKANAKIMDLTLIEALNFEIFWAKTTKKQYQAKLQTRMTLAHLGPVTPLAPKLQLQIPLDWIVSNDLHNT